MANFNSQFLTQRTSNRFMPGKERKFATSGHVLDANTVSLWRLDEADFDNSDIIDIGSLNLTLRNTVGNLPRSIPGKFGNALGFPQLVGTFSGINQTSNFAALKPTFTGSYTVETWAYFEYASGFTEELIAYSPNSNQMFSLSRNAAGRIVFSWWGNGSRVNLTGPTAQNGVWTHIACVMPVNVATCDALLYVNGALAASALNQQKNVDLNLATSRGLSLGAELGADDGSPNYYGGAIDDLRISNIARTPEEILQSYQSVGVY